MQKSPVYQPKEDPITRQLRSAALAAAVAVPFCIAALPAAAQLSLAVKQVYKSAGMIPTNIPGITTFPAPPKGFDPVHAEDTELARYGIPPRPADPEGYAQWAQAMSHLGQPATGPLVDMHISSRAMTPAGPTVSSATGGSTKVGAYAWSGVANTVPGLTFVELREIVRCRFFEVQGTSRRTSLQGRGCQRLYLYRRLGPGGQLGRYRRLSER